MVTITSENDARGHGESVAGPLRHAGDIKTSSPRPQRLRFIDAARGMAMWFVFLSHFAYAYFWVSDNQTHEILNAIGMVASPTFVLISGLLLGFLYRSSPLSDHLRKTYVNRGLFILTVGHVVILGAHIALNTGLRWGFITDALGASMIAGVLLIDKVPPAARLSISVGLYAASWLATVSWSPELPMLRFTGDTLFGLNRAGVYVFSFPVVPWFSVYFAASIIGEKIAVFHSCGDDASIRRLLIRLGMASIALAALVITFSVAVLRSSPQLDRLSHARQQNSIELTAIKVAEALAQPHPGDLGLALGSPFQKRPPSPVYLAFYGGVGFLLLYLCAVGEQSRFARRFIQYMSGIGRASLFAFVAQYYMYYTIVRLLAVRVSPWWPLHFLITTVVLSYAAVLWDRSGWNRWITVGYPWIKSDTLLRRCLRRLASEAAIHLS